MYLPALKKNLNIAKTFAAYALEAESKRNYAGYIWWILEPLFGVLIYYLLFKVFLNRGGDDYIQFLFLGLVLWKWYSDIIVKSIDSIYSKRTIYKKLYVNKIVFPVADIMYFTVKFLIVFFITLLCYDIFWYEINYLDLLIYLPYLIFSFLLVAASCAFIISGITPFLPDIRFLISQGLRLLFYASGILFSLDGLPEKYIIFVKINPIAQIIDSIRQLLMYNSTPKNILNITFLNLIFMFLLLLGFLLIQKYDKKYAKLL